MIMMKITVRYFASISDSIGKSSEILNVDHSVTVREVWQSVSNKVCYSGAVLVAVNHEYCSMNYKLNEMDELAFFPPVTGG